MNGNAENTLLLYKRNNNAIISWNVTGAVQDEATNTFTIAGQNTEYLIGRTGPVGEVILYENHFESPNIAPTENCAPDFDATIVNTLWSGTGTGTGGGGLFSQQNTVETIIINGSSNQYKDPSTIGGDYSLGMLSTVNDDKIALTLNSQSYPYINITFDLSAIAINGCGFGGALSTPEMNIKLYNTPSGVFDFASPGILLDEKNVTGTSPNVDPFIFNWLPEGIALNNSGSTNGFITVVLDLVIGNYASFDNIKIVSANQPLPLKLISFTGSKLNNDALLQWRTANEVNLSRFELQRSDNGQTFTSIGTVAAGGSSYSLTDVNTFSTRTGVYYRLRSIDLDGRFTYSNILRLSKQAGTTLIVYPNPVVDVLTINGLKQSGTIHIYNAEGKLLQQQIVSAQTMTISMGSYAKGIYLFQYKTADEVLNQKVIKE